MLGRLEMDVDECIVAYSQLTEAMFNDKTGFLPISLNSKTKAQFSSEKLKTALEKLIVDIGFSTADMFNDGKQRSCRT